MSGLDQASQWKEQNCKSRQKNQRTLHSHLQDFHKNTRSSKTSSEDLKQTGAGPMLAASESYKPCSADSKDLVLLIASAPSGSYILSTSPSRGFPEL